jgi:hypothetical protein
MNLAGFLFRVLVLTVMYLVYWYAARFWVYTVVEDDFLRYYFPIISAIMQLCIGVMAVAALGCFTLVRAAVGLPWPKNFYTQAFLIYLFATLVFGVVTSYTSHFELELRQT